MKQAEQQSCRLKSEGYEPICAILFDLDGTLLNTAVDFVNTLNQMRREKGLTDIDSAYVEPLINTGANGMLTQSLHMDKDNPEFYDTKKRFLDLYRSQMGETNLLFPGINTLLNFIEKQGWLWGIVTNKSYRLAKPLVKKQGLLSRLACLVGGDTADYPKPHPAPLLYACNVLELQPSQCIFIGDAEQDIAAAKAAKMRSIAVSFGYAPDKSEIASWQADAIAHSPTEIIDLLNKLAEKN